jgi:tetratricopeptide (TPR) repeat protein
MLGLIRRWFSAREPAAPSEPAQPLDELALLAPARSALAEGRDDDALRMLEALVWSHPQLAEAHRVIGDIHYRRRDLDEARDSYTLALHFSPASWRARYGLGQLEMEHRRFDAAIREFERAIDAGADDATLYNALGAAHAEAGAYPRAVECFRRAIALNPELAEPHSNLGYILFRELEVYAEGAALVEKGYALDPRRIDGRLNWAMLLQQQGELDRALALYEELLESDPTLSPARVNRGLIRLARGDFRRGWPDYEARQAIAQYATALGDAPEWDGSDLAGKRIAIYPEQGIGDEIMFASCVPDVLRKARGCTIVCEPRLVQLFSRSFPEATVVANGADASGLPRADWSVRMGSLPLHLRRDLGEFPAHHGYLRAEPARVGYWKARLAALPGARRIGISWRGGTPSTRRNLRSIALEQWSALLKTAGASFVSLQYTDCAEEIAEVSRRHRVDIYHWPDALADYDETAALVAALDLVISVQTAVVHLSGALGMPAWTLIPEVPEWRYGEEGETMPWYPSVTLMRKQRGEEWKSVLDSVVQRLASAT